MYFDFEKTKYIKSIELLDNDENSVVIKLFKNNVTTEAIMVTEGGDNGYVKVIIDQKLLTSMNIHFDCSGAILLI